MLRIPLGGGHFEARRETQLTGGRSMCLAHRARQSRVDAPSASTGSQRWILRTEVHAAGLRAMLGATGQNESVTLSHGLLALWGSHATLGGGGVRIQGKEKRPGTEGLKRRDWGCGQSLSEEPGYCGRERSLRAPAWRWFPCTQLCCRLLWPSVRHSVSSCLSILIRSVGTRPHRVAVRVKYLDLKPRPYSLLVCAFSRQEHWSGLPFPSPMHESEELKWSCSVVSDSSRPHGLQPTRLLRPWDCPGKSTGVGCHCLVSNSLRPHGLQFARLLCPWDSPGKNIGVGGHFLLQGIFPIQVSNACVLHLWVTTFA